MNEVAWCYLEGFGTKKDKVSITSTNTLPSTNDAVLYLCVEQLRGLLLSRATLAHQ